MEDLVDEVQGREDLIIGGGLNEHVGSRAGDFSGVHVGFGSSHATPLLLAAVAGRGCLFLITQARALAAAVAVPGR